MGSMATAETLGRKARRVSLLLALVFTLAPSSVSADVSIGTRGSGAGEIEGARGVAVDRAEDLLYVADAGNNRVDVFDATTGAFVRAFGGGVADGATPALQVCTSTCFRGLSGDGPGLFNGMEGIAVDNDPASPAFHSVYVFDNGNHRVQRFAPDGSFVWMVGGGVNETTGGNLCTALSGDTCGSGTAGDGEGQINTILSGGVAVGPGGIVYVADQVDEETGNRKIRVQKYEPSGAPAGQLILEVDGGAGRVTGLAVDSGGNIYVTTSNVTGAVRKFSPTGVELFEVNPSFNNSAVAVDMADRLFVADASGETLTSKIFEYSPTGTLSRTIYGSFDRVLLGLAPYTTPNGDIFTAELNLASSSESGVRHVEFPPPGPVVYPRGVVATGVGNTKATLNARINPEGEPTTYYFEYITDEDFKAAGETFGAGTVKTPTTSLGFEDFTEHPVAAGVTGLAAETLYHFRAVAENASGKGIGPAAAFVTKEPLEFGDVWSTDVGLTAATLNGEVNPLGIPATARFEYVELSEYEASGWANAETAPAGEPIDVGAGEAVKDVSAPVAGLQPGTAYRFRIVATDRCKPEPAPPCEFAGPEATFTTSLSLTPLTGCPNDSLRAAGSGTFLPDCRGYEMVSPVDKNGAFIEPVFNVNGFVAGLDQAALDGDSLTFSAYKAFGEVDSAPYTNQYLSRRGSGGWATEAISPEREGPSLMTYLSAQLDRQYKAFSADLCSSWVVQDASPVLAPGGIEGYPGLYRRDNCDPDAGGYEALSTLEPPATEPPNLSPRKFIPELQGTSADGSVAVFSVNDNLTADAPPQPEACVEETSPSAEPCEARLYEARQGQLDLVCVLPGGALYPDSCSVGTGGGSGGVERSGNLQHAISPDGSRIFWTASGSGPGNLYVRIDGTETIEISSAAALFWAAAADGSKAIYSVQGELFEYDVDGEAENLIAEGLIGVAGVSEDASRVYFASTEVLTGEEANSEGDKAEAGKPNLYLYEAGSGFEFIGTLASADASEAEPTPISRFPSRRLSRITPDGNHLVFMSRSSLTGYDNKDAQSKQPDFEVFLYDAGSDQLLCPSCNPSGARPEGRQLTQKLLEGRWAAARIPVFESQLYGSRVISDDGSRLYFNSFEALVSIDVNDAEDVYQWEAPGTGSCTTDDPTYHASNGGCVDLISSGQSLQGSELVDISADGRDVFFKTTESLVTQDPGLRDIYDARVEGGFPPLPPEPVICQGESCPKAATPPPGASSPTSSAAGSGNPVWPKPKPRKKKCRKGTHKVKTKAGKVRCVKNKRGKRKVGKRANKSRRAAR